MAESKLLTAKRYEHTKLVSQAHIQAREIRLMELDEEAIRCRNEIEIHKRVIDEMNEKLKALAAS